MPKTKISEFSATPGNNTDIDGINLAEGCAPSGINDAIRELMSQLKDFQAGTAGDSFNGPVGTTTAAAGAFTNLSASGTFALTGDQVQISEGGTGQTTANAAFNALAPSQSTHAGKYLKTDGTNTSWDALDISTADITGTLPVANGGTGVTSSTGTGSVVLSASPTFTGTVNGASLTLSSNFTLSGGTANGVAYLNGSKVLTTGSALTFDGTNFAVGTNTASTGIRLVATPISSANYFNNTIASFETNTSDGLAIYRPATTTIGFKVNNSREMVFGIGDQTPSEIMRLTSTGLGIGTSSPGYKLEVNGGASDAMSLFNSTNANGAHLRFAASGTVKSYIGGAPGFLGSGTADDLGIRAVGSILFATAGSGVDMTLDASGNLIVGTTSPAGSSQITAYGASNGQIAVQNSTNWSRILQNGNDLYIDNGTGGTGGNIIFRNGSSTTERARISSDGTFRVKGAGTAGSTDAFQVAGAAPADAARITSGGELLVGTTTAGLTAGGVRLKNGGGNLGEIALANNSGVADYVARFLWGTSPTLVGNITVSSTATAYNTSSDRRLKENIAPADDASAIVDAIQVVKHDWKAGGHTRYGVVAQDLHAVAPEAVSAGDDGEEIERTWSVDYSKLVPMLIKEIQSLRARVAALETK